MDARWTQEGTGGTRPQRLFQKEKESECFFGDVLLATGVLIILHRTSGVARVFLNLSGCCAGNSSPPIRLEKEKAILVGFFGSQFVG